MSTLSNGSPVRSPRSPLVWMIILPAVPVLNLGYQFCAETLAKATRDAPFGLAWIVSVFLQPWTALLAVLEIGSFAVWMIVLSRLSISVAFPLTAVSYALVVALGWFAFHEPIRPLEIVGAVAITTGVFLLRGKVGGD